jgi:hypothetical protein
VSHTVLTRLQVENSLTQKNFLTCCARLVLMVMVLTPLEDAAATTLVASSVRRESVEGAGEGKQEKCSLRFREGNTPPSTLR